MSSEILPKLNTNSPKLFSFEVFSSNVSKSQNCTNSTLACSKFVEFIFLVIPAQFFFGDNVKSVLKLLL